VIFLTLPELLYAYLGLDRKAAALLHSVIAVAAGELDTVEDIAAVLQHATAPRG
jgi:hypothetical protein